MKKRFMLFSALFVFTIFLTGCGNKKAISTSEFINITKSNGFEIVDAKDQFDEDMVLEATLAVGDDYKIEFYVLDSEFNANGMYKYNKSLFERNKSNVSLYSSTDLGNYSTYMLQSGGHYVYLSRIDNTFLYVDVLEEYKGSVKDIISKLGY